MPEPDLGQISAWTAMRLSLRHQIVGPFVVLVIFVGIVGTAVVTSQFASATSAGFDGSLLRGSLLANDHLALLEADRVRLVRAAANTLGVPDAVMAGDGNALARLLVPILANTDPAGLSVRILNREGRELLGLQQAPDGGPVARLASR